MTIAKKVVPTYKDLLGNLAKELTTIHTKSHTIHHQNELLKEQMLMKYRNQSQNESIDVEVNSGKIPDIDPEIINNISDINHINDKYKSFHLQNTITFLSSQRTYQELLERYNPGLTMSSSENLDKSANRVGLKLPKQKHE